MATQEQYAASIVEKYRVALEEGSPSHRVADEIVPLIKEWGQDYVRGITVSGAYAKNTAITLSSHVDVLVLVDPIPGLEIKSVFWRLFEFLTDHNLRANTREVSVRVPCKKLNVDLIPSYRDGKSGNILFNKRCGEAVHTDVAQHVHLVGNSGRQQEICALKIWRERSELEFPSFLLELATLRALENERFGQLAENVHCALRYLGSKFESAVIRDPANSDNIVSRDLSEKAKKSVAKAARDAIYQENWEKILH
jgi:predicted nucleotidyltransferase